MSPIINCYYTTPIIKRHGTKVLSTMNPLLSMSHRLLTGSHLEFISIEVLSKIKQHWRYTNLSHYNTFCCSHILVTLTFEYIPFWTEIIQNNIQKLNKKIQTHQCVLNESEFFNVKWKVGHPRDMKQSKSNTLALFQQTLLDAKKNDFDEIPKLKL